MTHFHLPHRAAGTGTRVEERTQSPPSAKATQERFSKDCAMAKRHLPKSEEPKTFLTSFCEH